jgi:hypothetical protein
MFNRINPSPDTILSIREYTEALLNGGRPVPAEGIAPEVRKRFQSGKPGYPRLAIYVGQGASHSWLWLASCLDRLGFYDVVLFSTDDLEDGLNDTDVVFFPGGDTFGMAEALGPEGLGRLKEFISAGGTYVGICAGAYLPMHSSLPSLSPFNLVRVKVNNLASSVPQARRMAHKFTQSYGCDLVFHAARGPLALDRLTGPLGYTDGLVAPVYGGPPMKPCGEAEALATFSGFTPSTEFLVDEDFARGAFESQVMAARAGYGKGVLYLYSAHFEHPGYPEANLAIANTIFNAPVISGHQNREPCEHLGIARSKELARELYGIASNLRVTASGLESSQVFWKIGQKVWEPEKARYFAESVWECARELRARSDEDLPVKDVEGLVTSARDALAMMKILGKTLRHDGESLLPARAMFKALNQFALRIYSVTYQVKLESVINKRVGEMSFRKVRQNA